MKKTIGLLVIMSFVFVTSANAQSTLLLQERCGEGAKKFYTETVLPSPFARYYRAKGETVECYVGNKKCKSIEEYDALIRPYMEE